MLCRVGVEAVEDGIDQQERKHERELPRPQHPRDSDRRERHDDGERVWREDGRVRPRRDDVRRVERIAGPGLPVGMAEVLVVGVAPADEVAAVDVGLCAAVGVPPPPQATTTKSEMTVTPRPRTA